MRLSFRSFVVRVKKLGITKMMLFLLTFSFWSWVLEGRLLLFRVFSWFLVRFRVFRLGRRVRLF